jgi:Family of unknown function (DUF5675)
VNLLLTRDQPPPPACTLGVFTVADLVLNTMERPWVPDPTGGAGGAPLISCVPPGLYQLVLHDTPEHPKTWALVNHELGVYHEPGDIPEGTIGRYACLIHPGNYAADVEGCIAPGMTREWNGVLWMVTSSQVAMRQLQAAVPWTTGHTLQITDQASVAQQT